MTKNIRQQALRVLVTGGAGFVGHHFVEHFIKNTNWHIVVLDKLTYAGTVDRLRDIQAFDKGRVTLLTADFSDPIIDNLAAEIGDIDYIFHLGGETHVDTSITSPERFVRANVLGTMHVLNLARYLNVKTFYYFSTDEVFGPAPEGVRYTEEAPHNPGNPYAVTKSSGEMLVKAFQNTYQIPCVITRSMNIFGERQHPEKFIPTVMRKVLHGDTVTIHANANKTHSGSRFYIHARNVADAYLHILDHGVVGESYNIVGEREVSNLALAQMIADILNLPLKYEMVDFHSSRPGHDLRYALDGRKLSLLGWGIPQSFETSLETTVLWTLARPRWYE